MNGWRADLKGYGDLLFFEAKTITIPKQAGPDTLGRLAMKEYRKDLNCTRSELAAKSSLISKYLLD